MSFFVSHSAFVGLFGEIRMGDFGWMDVKWFVEVYGFFLLRRKRHQKESSFSGSHHVIL